MHNADKPKTLYNQMNAEKLAQKHYSQVTKKYLLKSYGLGFFLAAFTMLGFHWAGDNDMAPFIVISFILYPFARIFYDVLVGFKLDYKMKGHFIEGQYFVKFKLIIHFLIYFFSFFLAPLGILYLIMRTLYRFIRK
ncbi:hypothetical protein MM221_10265 [Salipaludibacillus sp. LMS25]|jgi:hypothetical protein|uniref:hypothetical protein n=1 Tax=Salipaludibacillus sp. LMS25 TaxID=2924031 RepID=UPI0020D0430E|nr:hypothetical protein [Salipaludibacillus sp. LMS25]UTR16857.1 hypothetical protein MM221_10265 [Salipaludibacillus sp. LMS25]